MNRELRDKWCEALRSGAYRQGQGCFRRSRIEPGGENLGHEFCCLGVLADILKPQAWTVPENEKYSPWGQIVHGHAFGQRCFSTKDQHSIGLPKKAHDALWDANDSGYDFGEIAKLIEELVPVEEGQS